LPEVRTCFGGKGLIGGVFGLAFFAESLAFIAPVLMWMREKPGFTEVFSRPDLTPANHWLLVR